MQHGVLMENLDSVLLSFEIDDVMQPASRNEALHRCYWLHCAERITTPTNTQNETKSVSNKQNKARTVEIKDK